MSVVKDAKIRNPKFDIKLLRELNIKREGDILTFTAYQGGQRADYSMPEFVICTNNRRWELQRIKSGVDVHNIYVSPKVSRNAKPSDWWR